MSYTAPTVNYSATLDGTYTSLTGIQSVSINRGRQRFQDNFPQTSCVIELIPANSYTLPLAVGQFIDVRDANTSTSPCYFSGTITDVSRRFDMPFNAGSGAAPGDRITITASGTMGALGRSSVDSTSSFAGSATSAVYTSADQVRITVRTIQPSPVSSSSFTYTGSVLDVINGLLRTCQYFIDDVDANRSLNFEGLAFCGATFPPGFGNVNYLFSDINTVGSLKYNALEFESSVQNTFTSVEVVPLGLATQTAVSGPAPHNTLVYNTYNETTLDASNLAQLIIATQNLVQITPFVISTDTFIAPSCTTISRLSRDLMFQPGQEALRVFNLGAATTVEFRGTTVEAQIQGINTTFYPDQARVQLYLSPSLGAQFILDNSIFGVLDQNKLGF
jgi:hypothetical protein